MIYERGKRKKEGKKKGIERVRVEGGRERKEGSEEKEGMGGKGRERKRERRSHRKERGKEGGRKGAGE